MSNEPSPFARAYADLTGLGYSPVPLVAASAMHHRGRGKAPGRYQSGGWQGLESWQSLRTSPLSGFALGLALKAPEANVGLVMGTPAGSAPDGTPLFVISIDIDTDESGEAFDDIVRSIPRSPMRAKGKKGWKAFYRAPATVRSRGFDDSRVPAGQGLPRRLVDVLTGFDTRQAVVFPSIHPDTMVEYCWLEGPVRADTLPIFNDGDMEHLIEVLQMHGYDPGAARQGRGERKAYVPTEHDAGDVFEEVKAAALANLSAWVPDLPGLFGLRPARGGYEAVNTLRDSGSGQPLERRKRNLSIQASGIKDFGSNETWSAIDLVADFADLTVSEAISWLEERLPGFAHDVEVDVEGLIAHHSERASTTPLQKRQTPAPSFDNARAREERLEGEGNDGRQAGLVPTHEMSAEFPAHLLKVPGLVGDLMEWMSRTAQRPLPIINLGASLCIVGTLAARKWATPTEGGTHLYILGLAGTGQGKDHPRRAATHILAAAGLKRFVAPSSWKSDSALVQHVSRNPACISFSDEVGEFIGRLNSKGASTHERGVSGVMRELWGVNWGLHTPPGWADSRDRQRVEPISAPAYSFLGLSVPEAVWEALAGADLSNGFANRFLVLANDRDVPEQDPEESVFDVPESLLERLRGLADFGGHLANITMHHGETSAPIVRVPWEGGRGSHAHQVFKAFQEFCRVQPESETLMKRTAEIACRLATIRAVGIGGEDAAVTVQDIEWGRDVALWSARRMIADTAAYMSESDHQARVKLVLRIIQASEDGYISRTALCRKVNHRFDARTLDNVIEGLRDAGQIRLEESDRRGAGRKASGYFAI